MDRIQKAYTYFWNRFVKKKKHTHTEARTPHIPRPTTLSPFSSPRRQYPIALLSVSWQLNQRQKVHSGFRTVQAAPDSSGFSLTVVSLLKKWKSPKYCDSKSRSLVSNLLNHQQNPHKTSTLLTQSHWRECRGCVWRSWGRVSGTSCCLVSRC